MRLITKATLLYILLSLLVFGSGGYTAYHVIQKKISKETDYTLVQNLHILEKAIAEKKPIDALQNQKITIQTVNSVQAKDTVYAFSDTLAMHPYWKRLEPHRKLKITQKIGGVYYQIQMIDNFLELDDMYSGVFSLMSRLFVTLGSVLLLCSFLISRLLFRPFQSTLENIRSFNLKSSTPIPLVQTSTKEFQQLNDFITTMTSKASRDYESLKEFSENAAHEMQTPIAIAKGKLELLSEKLDMQPEQLKLVEDAQLSLTKLSRLGQSLSLLTKIDNKEFAIQESTNFSELVQSSVRNFKDICDFQQIKLDAEIMPKTHLNIHPALADILVSNLLKNAIRHNVANGWIKVNLNNKRLLVKNPGLPPKIPTEQLFQRFKKSNQSANSLGLGLAIVKKICDVNQLKVSYDFKEQVHELRVIFA